MSSDTTIETDLSGTSPADVAGGRGRVMPGRSRRAAVTDPPESWPSWLLRGVVLLAVALVVSLVVQFLAARLPIPVPSNVPAAIVTWCGIAGLVVAALLFAGQRWPRLARDLGAAAVLAALATVVIAVPLHGTHYYLGGISVDQQFRTQYLTRLTDTAGHADMNYADVAPFYPSGWFWIGGRLAGLMDVPGWQAYKPLSLFTLAVVPVGAYWVWSRLVSRRVGLVVGLVVVAAGLSEAATEPYSWAVAALLPGVAVLVWRSVAPGGHHHFPRLIGVGLFLGLSASVYTLYAGFAAVSFAALGLWGVWLAGRGARLAALRRVVLDLVVVAVTTVVVALPVWTPYLLAVLRGEGGRNVAAHFLPTLSTDLPTPMLNATPWGALLAVGAGYVLWQLVSPTAAERRTVVPLGVLVVLSYAWYGLSTLALGLRTTLLAYRLETVITVSLGISGVLALRAAWRWVRLRWPELSWSGRAPAAVVTSVVAVFLAAVVLQQNAQHFAPQLDDAYSDPYPSGPNATGEVLDDRDERWVDQLAAAIDARTGRPADRTVVLTTDYTLLSFEPYWGFQQITPHYANPLADYPERSRFIEALADTKDPVTFLQQLDRSPWRAPTAFVLRTESDGLHLDLHADAFPREPNVSTEDVVFDPAAFSGWSTTQVGPFTVLVRPGE